MFRVKICGITNVEDAIAAVEAGADAIGLNFYEKSPRFVTRVLARDVRHGVPSSTGKLIIGVYVDQTQSNIANDWGILGLDGIQLHGNETPDLAAHFVARMARPPDYETYLQMQELRKRGLSDAAKQLSRDFAQRNPPLVIRVFRWSAETPHLVRADAIACEGAGGKPRITLIDASAPGCFGGTGRALPWNELANHSEWLGDSHLVLAGGLTPDNVAEAIRIVRPAAVDVASGVESAPGKKDPVKVRDFVANALGAFEALGEN